MNAPTRMVDTPDLVTAIHASGRALAMAVTGGGSEAIAALLTVAGASKTVLEAIVPYSSEALVALLRARPEQFCSSRTARSLAMAAFQRAVQYQAAATPAESLVGLGCTASLASTQPKRGPHRIHLAAQTADATMGWSLELQKGARSRRDEEHLAAGLILNLLAEVCRLDVRVDIPLRTGEVLHTEAAEAPAAWQELLTGQRRAVCHPDSARIWQPPRCVFPGAFDPLHEGHRQMAVLAAERTGLPVDFELSIRNVDKLPLDYLEIQHRLAALPADARIWLTQAPTFAEKSQLFPGATFVVGIDTLSRIGDCRYYGSDASARDKAIQQIANNGCRFLAFGRLVGQRFTTAAEVPLPGPLAALCQGLEEGEFRRDISSTELRRADSREDLPDMAEGDRG